MRRSSMHTDDTAKDAPLLSRVADYYSAKLAQHGQSPQRVDWNSAESQHLRFAQLTRIIGNEDSYSINDLGCGYGAFYDYLRTRNDQCRYLGCDVSSHMIEAARQRHSGCEHARYVVSAEPPEVADYGVASGVFNVRLDLTDSEWKDHIEQTLDTLDRTSRLGFAFN